MKKKSYEHQGRKKEGGSEGGKEPASKIKYPCRGVRSRVEMKIRFT